MSRTRRVVGIVVGVLLLLSAVAHSLLGGEALRTELTAAQVPPDLLRGALIGWYFGGAAMLLAWSGLDPFFLVFVIPGLLLSWAAFPQRTAHPAD